MIKHLSIDGYKCLKNANLAAGNLNILVGPNASGKSSVLQTLLLLRQSADKGGNVDGLHLSGPLYEAGTVQDVLHPNAEHQIKLALRADNKLTELLFRYIRDDTVHTPKRLLPADTARQLPDALHDHDNGFACLNAERLGPRVTYTLPSDEPHPSGLVGKGGEHAAAVLARASNEGTCVDGWNKDLSRLAIAPKKLDGLELGQDLENTQGRLDLVCNQMLGWVLPGAEFDAQEHDQSDAASLRFIRDPLATKASATTTLLTAYGSLSAMS
ncbi:MAG: AAA family ATPase [Gammaproteobacteria bacterium]|nr:AAA family ATPase [Gammaproteobacteria bacterium]